MKNIKNILKFILTIAICFIITGNIFAAIPVAPSNVSVSIIQNTDYTSAKINWEDTESETGYIISIAELSPIFLNTQIIAQLQTEKDVTEIINNWPADKLNKIKVAAFNEEGTSTWSEITFVPFIDKIINKNKQLFIKGSLPEIIEAGDVLISVDDNEVINLSGAWKTKGKKLILKGSDEKNDFKKIVIKVSYDNRKFIIKAKRNQKIAEDKKAKKVSFTVGNKNYQQFKSF